MLSAVFVLSLAVSLACGLPVETLYKSAEFDHYVFTQEYPAGSCYCYRAEVFKLNMHYLNSK